LRTFVGAVPLSVLAITLTLVVSLAASDALARRLHSKRSVAALLLFGFGFVLSATVVPTGAALEGEMSDGVCDFSRIGLASIDRLTRLNVTTLNVLLFVPLGVAVGLLPRTRQSLVVALAATSLTFVVELIQLLLPALGRGCETADMADNLLGLALGLFVGIVLRPFAGRV
jgi:hypothetical protein